MPPARPLKAAAGSAIRATPASASTTIVVTRFLDLIFFSSLFGLGRLLADLPLPETTDPLSPVTLAAAGRVPAPVSYTHLTLPTILRV